VAELEFRPYKAEDRETCRAIIAGHVGSYLAVGEDADFERFLDQLEANSESLVFWLATLDGQAVGCAGLSISGDEARLLWGILDRRELGKGYGQKMLDLRMDWIRKNHPEIKSVLCHTAPLTEGFFAKNGFETFHRQANYWGGELDLVAMRKVF